MTEASPSPDEELREQAASWFVRMRGPDSEALRPEFQQWLASTPARRGAYNRIAARFSEAKLLRASASHQIVRTHPEGIGSASRMRRLVYALAAVLGLSMALITVYPRLTTDHSRPALQRLPGQQVAFLATRYGEIRSVRLADGSVLSLDTDSLLTVRFSADRRELHLERGRARFDVAHEGRPFIVSAGGATVTARGTLFDVTIDTQRHVRVVLMRGAVDVATEATASRDQPVRHLRPGEAIAFAAGARILAPPLPSVIQPSWPTGMVDFDEAPMREVVAEANRYARTPILLPDRQIQALRVSGRFGVRDADALAVNLGRLFDLAVDRSSPDAIVLHRPAA